jgi:nucleoside-diphosphate-sugar epimerase
LSKILITGVAGFIGSHTAELFLAKGYEVVGVDNFDDFYPKQIKEANLKGLLDTRGFQFAELDFEKANLLEIFPDRFDGIIHLGAKAGVLPSIKNTEGYIESNITGTYKILDYMVKTGASKLVFASSSSVYGNSQVPFAESADVSRPISPYAFSKKAGELLTYNYHHLYKLDVLNLRFFTVFGERQRPDLAIHKFVKAILNGEPITLYGKGDTSRDYTYVKDIVQGIWLSFQYLAQNQGVYEILNIGNNKPITLLEMVETIKKVLGLNPEILFSEPKPGDVDRTFASIEKAKSLLGYQPETSFEEGIRHFVSWYKNQNAD